jgi:hypothetical protein
VMMDLWITTTGRRGGERRRKTLVAIIRTNGKKRSMKEKFLLL